MIPRKIHYCWFGKNPIPEQYLKYMESWKKYCPDFEIIEWNEDNFDVMENDYCREAYEAKKWAFVSDYARLKIIYEHGGIYLDTDVEVLKPLTPLIENGIGFIGFQNSEEATTGLGFAAVSRNYCVGKMLQHYKKRHFLKEANTVEQIPCPVANTVALKQCGMKNGKKESSKIQHLEGMDVFPVNYFNPLDADTMQLSVTADTYTIHHYSASWYSEKQKNKKRVKKIIPRWILQHRAVLISKRDIRKLEKSMEEK